MIGLDVGHNHLHVAVVHNDMPSLVRDDRGRSAISIEPHGGLSLRGLCALLGRQAMDPAIESVRLPIEMGPQGEAWLRLGGEVFSPVQLLVPSLTRARELARARFSVPTTLTVSTSAPPAARADLVEAARLAGFSVERIIGKSTARAISAGRPQGYVASVDIGDGVDVSVMRITPGQIEVLGACGDALGGGHALDACMVTWMIAQLVQRYKKQPDELATTRLWAAAENARHHLDNVEEIRLDLPFLTSEQGGAMNLDLLMTRARLAATVRAPTDRIRALCQEAMARAGLSASDLDHVLIGGGLSRSKMILRHLEATFERRLTESTPSAALGAAIFAGERANYRLKVIERAAARIEIVAAGERTPFVEIGDVLPATLELDAPSGPLQLFIDEDLAGEINAQGPIRLRLDRSGLIQALSRHEELEILWLGDFPDGEQSSLTISTHAMRSYTPDATDRAAGESAIRDQLRGDLARLDEAIRRLDRSDLEPAQLEEIRDLSADLYERLLSSTRPPADDAQNARLRERLQVLEQELAELRAWARSRRDERSLLRERFSEALDGARQSANEQLVRAVLPALDALEGANDEQSQRALQVLQRALRTAGLRRIRCREGDLFDPDLHEARGVVSLPHLPDRALIETLRRGYLLGDRPIRPAQVILNVLDESPDEPI